MTTFRRYAIYYVPANDGLAEFADRWLGWSARKGAFVDPLEVAGLSLPLAEITEAPRKYGFHATLKPPFRLADTSTEDRLIADCARLATSHFRVEVGQLALTRLGRFLALTVSDEGNALQDLAAALVTGLDLHRRPMSEEERERRASPMHSARQIELLNTWGYPFVLDQFRFHMTLTGKLRKADLVTTEAVLRKAIEPLINLPTEIDSFCLCVEDAQGFFNVLKRFDLAG